MLVINMCLNDEKFTILFIHAPEGKKPKQETKDYYNQINEVLETPPQNQQMFFKVTSVESCNLFNEPVRNGNGKLTTTFDLPTRLLTTNHNINQH